MAFAAFRGIAHRASKVPVARQGTWPLPLPPPSLSAWDYAAPYGRVVAYYATGSSVSGRTGLTSQDWRSDLGLETLPPSPQFMRSW